MLCWAVFSLLLAGRMMLAAGVDLFVVAPNVMRFDSMEKVAIYAIGGRAQLRVIVELQPYPLRDTTYSQKTAIVSSSGGRTTVHVQTKLTDLSRSSHPKNPKVYLRVKCPDIPNFGGPRKDYKEVVIPLTGSKGFLFLQTDKPIYTPKQEVKIRAISLNIDMRPARGPYFVEVRNPNKDVVARYTGDPAKKILSEKLQLPPVTVMGNWSVTATYNNQYENRESIVVFEVKEYVLPTFSVDIETPDYILPSANLITVTVTARYVYQEKVKGKLTLLFSLEKLDGSVVSIRQPKRYNFDGELTIDLPRAQIQRHWFPDPGTRLVVEAAVIEGATGKQEIASDKTAVFYQSPYKISFERTIQYFKPGLPYQLKIDLKYANGEPAVKKAMTVSAQAIERGQQNPTNVLRRAGEEGDEFKSDNEGRRAITLDVPSNAERLIVKVETVDETIKAGEQASAEITIRPTRTRDNNYLAIQLTDSTGRQEVGVQMQFRVDFTDHAAKKVIIMILARGRIVLQEIKDVNGRSMHHSVLMTADMAPQARLLVFYASKGNMPAIIADSMVVEVSKTCREELTLSGVNPSAANSDSYAPGDNFKLKVDSAKGAFVSVIGVDKAVYLLSERDILTRNKMFNSIMELDIGCGPGGGSKAANVFKDAGVHLITNASPILTPGRGSVECPAKKRRRKRSLIRRERERSRRLFSALMEYDHRDGRCCGEAFSPEVQTDSRSCQVLAENNILIQGTVCLKAFIRCCLLEREINMPTGRAVNIDDDEVPTEELDFQKRSKFKDTWIDEIFEMGDKSSKNEMLKVPDSITTWVISGVSVSDQGMCVAHPFNITAKKEFFLHLDLPYSAIRGEQLTVRATVYYFTNRIRQHTAYAWMEADQSDICFAGNNGVSAKKSQRISSNSGYTFTFPVVPLKIGKLKLTVKGKIAAITDWVERELNVVAEGVPRSMTASSKLDPEGIMGGPGSGNGFINVTVNDIANKHVVLQVPLGFKDDAIPGTEVCSISITGDLLGPMIPNRDLDMGGKIYKPTGCGEQTVIHMGPLVYVTRYLLKTDSLTGALEQNAYNFIKAGFRRELTYKKPDGSYAAWLSRPSSAWLTAFVLKVFCQASQFPQVGEEAVEPIKQAMNWLVTKAQKPDGRFHDAQRVIHRGMYGQNMRNPVTFTAFVIEAITSCRNVSKKVDITKGKVRQGLVRAMNYMVNRKDTLNNPYDQAILTYVLALHKNQWREAAMNKLKGMSSFDSATGMRYFNADGSVRRDDGSSPWYHTRSSALTIETASYAVLAQLAMDGSKEINFQYAGPIVAWLIQQRTGTGAFTSTTDTIMGLEAITAYAGQNSTRNHLNMIVKVSGGKLDISRTITRNEADEPWIITEDLPLHNKVTIGATGTGIGQVQVTCQYNSPAKPGELCPFNMTVTAKEGRVPAADLNVPVQQVRQQVLAQERADAEIDDGDDDDEEDGNKKYAVTITAEFNYIGSEDRVGMSILDVALYSGFYPVLKDLDELKENNVIDNYETVSSRVLIYLASVEKATTKVEFRAERNQTVKGVQPAAVRLYDYYEPEKRYCTKFYHPEDGSPLLATICDADNEGRKVCQCASSECAIWWGINKKDKKYNIKSKDTLLREVCTIYDYAVKITAGPTVVDGPLKRMTATVEASIKTGIQHYTARDTMNFVWRAKCDNPQMTEGTQYLILGKDGTQYLGKDGRVSVTYVLNRKSFVIEWNGAVYPRYTRNLEVFKATMINDGCGQ